MKYEIQFARLDKRSTTETIYSSWVEADSEDEAKEKFMEGLGSTPEAESTGEDEILSVLPVTRVRIIAACPPLLPRSWEGVIVSWTAELIMLDTDDGLVDFTPGDHLTVEGIY